MEQENGKLLKNLSELELDKNYSPSENSPVRNAGILHFEEPDASLDCGAVPFGTEFDFTCGAGSSIDLSKASKFRQQVNYDPGFIRSLGPEKGTWGVYSFDKASYVPLEIPADAKTLSAVFKLTDCTRPHENITRKWNLFSADNFLVQIISSNQKSELICVSGKTALKYDLGKLNRDIYQNLTINFGKNIILNGKIISGTPLEAPKAKEGKTEIYRNVLFDLQIK